MARVIFNSNLRRHVSAPSVDTSAATVREALESVFDNNPRLRSYILDDQSRVRHHVVVFVAGQRIKDPITLSDTVGPDDEIYVMQALSGG
jgi:hypothetical protein